MASHQDLAERMSRARDGLRQAGFDALLVTPGADLRYLTGYHALPLERLTCLVLPAKGGPCLVVPALEEPAAQASPISRLGVQIVPWQETEDPVTLVSRLLGGTTTVALDDHMWAEKVLRFRAAMPNTQQVLAGPVLRHLRMRKSTAEIQALRGAGAAIDRVHARMSEWLRAGRTEREVGRDIADAGVTAESVDAAARDIIAAAGYGKAFLHRTGHGIGLESHEDPYIVAGNSTVLEPGMAFSIEPGIYLPGRHGARIEDIVVVTNDGSERLNLRPRELAVLPT